MTRPKDGLNRRTFTKAASLTVATGFFSRSVDAAQPYTRPRKKGRTGLDYDVVVIGAGLAGVIAARELRNKGYRVLILEARNRVGGRMFSSKFAGQAVELGGNWTFWGHSHMYSEITRYGLHLKAELGTTQPEEVYWLTGKKVKQADFATYDAVSREAIMKFYADAANVFPNPYQPFASSTNKKLDSLSVKDRLDSLNYNTEQRNLVGSFIGSACSNFTDKCSLVEALHWYRLHGSYQSYGDAMSYKIKEGTASLVNAIISDGNPDVELGRAIVKVSQSTKQCIVTDEFGDSVSGRAVLVAVPINTLADIDFVPKLMPEKDSMVKQGHSGTGIKFYARVAGPLPPLMAFGSDTTPITLIFTVKQLEDSSIICGFGPSPKILDTYDNEMIEEALRMWIPQIEVLESYSYDWNADPYSKGTWSVYAPMQISRYLEAMQKAEGRIFFVGSDIANGFRGFMDGAVESGLTVAREVSIYLA